MVRHTHKRRRVDRVRLICDITVCVQVSDFVGLLCGTGGVVFPLELAVLIENVDESVRHSFVFHGTWILGIDGLFDQLVIRGHEKLFIFGRQIAVDRFRRLDLGRHCVRQTVRILNIRLEVRVLGIRDRGWFDVYRVPRVLSGDIRRRGFRVLDVVNDVGRLCVRQSVRVLYVSLEV